MTPELQTSDYSARHSHLDTKGLSAHFPKQFTLLARGRHICKQLLGSCTKRRQLPSEDAVGILSSSNKG
jgi:hypothetical protein